MRIFIAAASEDEALAKEIKYALEDHRVFLAAHNLRPGAHFHARIRQEISRADLFVFLASRHSTKPGNYTLSELEIAKDKWEQPGDHIMAVLVGKVPIVRLDPYLRATTVLTPSGNAAADVAAAVARRTGLRTTLGALAGPLTAAVIAAVTGVAVLIAAGWGAYEGRAVWLGIADAGHDLLAHFWMGLRVVAKSVASLGRGWLWTWAAPVAAAPLAVLWVYEKLRSRTASAGPPRRSAILLATLNAVLAVGAVLLLRQTWALLEGRHILNIPASALEGLNVQARALVSRVADSDPEVWTVHQRIAGGFVLLAASVVALNLAARRILAYAAAWPRSVAYSRGAAAAALVANAIGLSQLHGIVTLGDVECMSLTLAAESQLKYAQQGASSNITGWMLSDTKYDSTVQVMEPPAGSHLWQIPRADVSRVELEHRKDCDESILPGLMSRQ